MKQTNPTHQSPVIEEARYKKNEKSDLPPMVKISSWLEKITHLESAKNKSLVQLRMNEYQELCELQKKFLQNIKEETQQLKNSNQGDQNNNSNDDEIKEITDKIKNELTKSNFILNDIKSVLNITKRKFLNEHYDSKGKIDSNIKHLYSLSVKA